VAKTGGQMGAARRKKGQGFYSAGSQARLHMQPPISAPVLLQLYQQRSSSQQSTQQRTKLPNTWHKPRLRDQQLGKRHRGKAMAIFK